MPGDGKHETSRMIETATRVAYRLLGTLYILVGSGAVLLPTAWLPQALTDGFLLGETPSPFLAHVLQEFGTLMVGMGLAFLWYAGRRELSPGFHWAMTFYLALDAFIHWVGPAGPIGSWSRGIVNSIPFAVMLLLGVLRRRASRKEGRAG